jgi:hypothetical protein
VALANGSSGLYPPDLRYGSLSLPIAVGDE